MLLDFDQLYKENRMMVLRFLVNKTRNRSDSEELTNDIFIKVFNHLADYDANKSTFKTWLIAITNNSLTDYYRTKNGTNKAKAFSNMINTDDESDDEVYQVYQIPYRGANADALYDSKIILNNIDNAIESLNGNARLIAREFFINNLKHSEICDKLDLPLGTVKATINRIREKLQVALKAENEMCLG